MKKLVLATFLMVLVIIAWRIAQAPVDTMGSKDAGIGHRPERAESRVNHDNLRNRPERRESRGTHQIAQRDFLGLFTPDRMKRAAETLDRHLAQQQRSAQSLLAAYRISGDIALLREAAGRFPDEPSVQLEMVMKGDSPAERRKALDALRAAGPENALADCFSALQHLKGDDLESAFKDLTAAAGKPGWNSYDDSKIHGAEVAYLAAGFSPPKPKLSPCLACR